MLKHSKRYYEIKNILKKNYYSLDTALNFFKELPPILNTDILELHIALNLKRKEFKQYSFKLLHPLYIPQKICVLVTEAELQNYKNLDIDILGSKELLYPILKKKINFDMLFTTFNFYPQIKNLIKYFYPKYLFPNKKIGNLTFDIQTAIFNIKQGILKIKSDLTHVLHIVFGQTCFSLNALKDNIKHIFLTIFKDSPYQYIKLIKTISLCSTMSPSISLNKIDIFKDVL